MCEKCPYPEFFWSSFSLIRTEYVERYSIQMRERRTRKTPNTDIFYAVMVATAKFGLLVDESIEKLRE